MFKIRNNFNLLLVLCFLTVTFSAIALSSFRKESNSTIPNQNIEIPFMDKQVKTSLMLTGDVMLGRSVEISSIEETDYSYPFRKVGEKLSKADIVFINLENPIIENCPRHDTGFKFCANPRMAEGLSLAGVDIVNFANNHSKNYGEEGIKQTLEILSQRGIAATGLGELVTLEVKGTVFGFLGFDLTVKNLSDSDLALIRESDGKVDILVVAVHWGVEYTEKPTDIQRQWAKKMVSEGADLISGHHPHWVQGNEIIEGKPVFYSLGNFVFDQTWSEKTKQGVAVEVVYNEGEFDHFVEHPIYMFNRGQPSFSAAYLGE